MKNDFLRTELKNYINKEIKPLYKYDSLTKEYIKKLHEYNITVNCWTVDIEAEAYELMDMGIDIITSNCLE